MEQLTRDLLQYCRVAREDMTPQPVEVNALIKDVMAMNNFVLPSNAQLVVRDGMARVLANPTLLGQCLSNLLNNAFKFSASNLPPRVEVWTEHQDSRVRINVQDNGIGIDPAHHQKIFGIFERVGNVKAHDGTGIGLAIVARAVQRMGGQCGVDSKLGSGSRFWIELQSAP
jgi:signal transduction histidine kinase